MKEVKNCSKCNAVFSTNDGSIFCRKCEAEEEKAFKLIRDYIYENPGTSIHDLCVKFNISLRRVDEYIRNGKIEST